MIKGDCKKARLSTKMRTSSLLLTTPFAILLSLQSTLVSAAPTPSIWDVHIDKDPAPPPDKGPPLSIDALRDKSKLKYEIIGIVGAYLFWVFVSLFLILFVGRRLRRKTQSSISTLGMEFIKPVPINAPQGAAIEPPLKSPGRLASLKSWASGGKTHSHKPSDISVSSTIDEKVVEQDRTRNMDEMARLYAAVMIHDEERSQKSSSGPSPVSPRTPKSPHYPAEFQHLRNAPALPEESELSAQALNHTVTTTSSTYDDEYHSANTSRASSHKVKASPLSFLSNGQNRPATNTSSKPRPNRISIRGQPISEPIGSADLRNGAYLGEQMPLSPRYNPGPPPPTPGRKYVAIAPIETTKAPTPQSTYAGSTAGSQSNSSLPFRQMYQDSCQSAPATKTTFLHRREKLSLLQPKTGVPQTPYSPYMPFTPMTPITPGRLMTKEDMKRKKKKEGLKVLSEDDMVMSDEDMWGSVA